MKPGLIEKKEFEYTRHGTVNFLARLVVHSGQMRGWCPERNDSANLCALLPQLLGDHCEARRIHLIWDNGPSPTAQQTRDFLRTNYPHVRVLYTPAHASWLNQAELLLRAFGARYLKRGNWASIFELIGHLEFFPGRVGLLAPVAPAVQRHSGLGRAPGQLPEGAPVLEFEEEGRLEASPSWLSRCWSACHGSGARKHGHFKRCMRQLS